MVRDSVANVVDALQQAGFGPRKVGHDSWLARCPAHRGADLTLAITRNELNHVLLECKSTHNCQYLPIIKALGLTNDGIFAETPGWLIHNHSRIQVWPMPPDTDIDWQARPERDNDREHAPCADLASDGAADSRAAAVSSPLTDLVEEVGPIPDIVTDGLFAAPGEERTLANPERESSVQVLLRLAACARLFHSEDGRFLAQVPVGDRVEVYGLKSPAFRHWLIAGYQADQGQPPAGSTVGRVIGLLEAQTRFDSTIPAIFVRVGQGGGEYDSPYWLDLGDASGTAIKIAATGWLVVDRPGVNFRRPQGLLPLPMPVRDGSVELLRRYVNLAESDFRLLITWLTAALMPVGPHPILVLQGEQGSAKSTLAKVLRLLIDPQACPLLTLPKSTRDLVATAVNGWLLAYDNISTIPTWLSDALCQLVFGLGFASRTLFTNDERSVIHARRPVILNGIEDFVTRGDLRDRSVFLHLPRIAPAVRLAESEFWRAFRGDYPRILGGILDGIVAGMNKLPSVRLAESPRMADYARWGEAFARGAGWGEGTFLATYNDNRKDATDAILDDSPLATILLQVVRIRPIWTTSPVEMHAALTSMVDKKVAASARWPKTLRAFCNQLRAIAPLLRLRGCSITFNRKHAGRSIAVQAERAATPGTATTSPDSAAESGHGH